MRAERVAAVLARPAVLAPTDVAKVLVARGAAVGLWRDVVARVAVKVGDATATALVWARLGCGANVGGRGAVVVADVALAGAQVPSVAAMGALHVLARHIAAARAVDGPQAGDDCLAAGAARSALGARIGEEDEESALRAPGPLVRRDCSFDGEPM